MLIRGGENIYPREIEEFLFTHPSVVDARVFGVPDDKYGEAVCGWVITKSDDPITESQLREFCRNQIAHFKVPQHIRFKEEVPLTVTGKPQKFLMREAMIEDLGLVEATTA
jgi:fatty-acyl-CoA synthase